jgi:hypothetical protein
MPVLWVLNGKLFEKSMSHKLFLASAAGNLLFPS